MRFDSGFQFFFRGVSSEKSQCFALDGFWLISKTPLLIIIGRRLERALVVYFAFEGLKIVGWQPEGILLRLEMLIAKSFKCNGKILGSIGLCNILSARLH